MSMLNQFNNKHSFFRLHDEIDNNSLKQKITEKLNIPRLFHNIILILSSIRSSVEQMLPLTASRSGIISKPRL